MGDHVVTYPIPSSSTSSKYVKLNVGGTLHYTTIGTLVKHDNMLRAMFSGRMEVLTDSEGWILIDRCGKHFGLILNFLRDAAIALPENRTDVQEILIEAKYYCVQQLVEVCEQTLTKSTEDYVPLCRVPVITSAKEEQILITTSKKPIVKLSCNRHNNKYSYTSNSDDNILRNIELFDKLSLRFSERILFLKDVCVSNEICLWSFYGNGQKIVDVDCTSIVYGQDKKHTKVEFPEARIYEETLNSLLYENRDSLPDSELMKATMSLRPNDTERDERERVERGVDRLRRSRNAQSH